MKLKIYKDLEQNNKVKKELLGYLEYEGNNKGVFYYDKNYVIKALNKSQLGISTRLPLTQSRYSKVDFDPFFSGLLPEGETYNNLALMYQVPNHEYLYVLEKLGCECIGALTFITENSDNIANNPHYEQLDNNIIEQIKSNPVKAMTLNASNTRLSLSGAQSKTAWFLPHNKSIETVKISDWQIPYDTAPSTHIIKVSRKGEEELALNEYACSLIAKECKIESYDVSLIEDIPGAIAIQRYDREWVDNSLLRLHQEDFCQALGLAPYMKYQPTASETSYLSLMSDLLNFTSLNPIEEKAELAKRIVFNFILGNTDAHLKNYSILYNKDWTTTSLAPMYDLTCIPLTGYSQNLPFRIGDHWNLDEITKNDIMSIALDLDTNLNTFDKNLQNIIKNLSSIKISNQYIDKILNNAAPRIRVIEGFLEG